ncbi:orexin receptor type [Plakobranchus ocellatus]|uniref:Orexin receptor type n=1 Tax=Plakobranchus ocellatus TaxID=259542 RepID=A0AAV3ZQ74_9GAST|nr:orexin receptor type [Plakobranchus ocellatus]
MTLLELCRAPAVHASNENCQPCTEPFINTASCENVSVIVSVLTLTTISVERWFAICKPLTFQQTRTRVIACMVVIWLVAYLASIPVLFIHEISPDIMIPPNLTILLTSCGPKDAEAAFSYEIFLSITFFLLLLVMGYNYTAIALCLWSSSNTTRHLTARMFITEKVPVCRARSFSGHDYFRKTCGELPPGSRLILKSTSDGVGLLWSLRHAELSYQRSIDGDDSDDGDDDDEEEEEEVEEEEAEGGGVGGGGCL